MMAYRYYEIEKSIRKIDLPYQGNIIGEIISFEQRTKVDCIGRTAWGFVDYDTRIPALDARKAGLLCAEDDEYETALKDVINCLEADIDRLQEDNAPENPYRVGQAEAKSDILDAVYKIYNSKFLV